MTWQQPHMLILDEPTNHLDYKSIDALIGAINSFEGGVVAASHDQYFISSIYNELYVVEKGRVKKFDDTFEDYVAEITPALE